MDEDFIDCDLCAPGDDSEPYPYPHCCLCGDTGRGDLPPCTWE